MFANKDTSLIILSKLNDRDLLSTCMANRAANKLCQDQNFWRNRFISQYGESDFQFLKDKVKNWRKFMLLLIKYISLGNNNYNGAMIYAAKEGDRNLVDFFISKGANNWNDAMLAATEGGHKDLVEFFINEKETWWTLYKAIKIAVKKGYKDLVDFFIHNGASLSLNYGMKIAIKNNNKELINYFIEKGADKDRALYYAAREGNYELFDFLISIGAKITSNVYDLAYGDNREDLIDFFDSKKEYEPTNKMRKLKKRK